MGIPLPVLADTYRVTLNWKDAGNGQTAASVMHFKMGASTAAGVKTAIDTNVTAAMWTAQHANAQVISLDIIKLDGTSGRLTFPVTGAKWTGGGSSSDSAPQVANLVKMSTGLRGPANRGRVFLPMVGENQTTGGSLGGAGVTAGNAAWAAFLAAMTAAVCFPVVAAYDRKHAGAGAHTNLVVLYTYEAVLATQRKRQERLR